MKEHPNLAAVATAGAAYGALLKSEGMDPATSETAYQRILLEIERQGLNEFYDAADIFTDNAIFSE